MPEEAGLIGEASEWLGCRTVGLIMPVPVCTKSDPVSFRDKLVATVWAAEPVAFWARDLVGRIESEDTSASVPVPETVEMAVVLLG